MKISRVVFVIGWIISSQVQAQAETKVSLPKGLAKLTQWTETWKTMSFEFTQTSTMPEMDYDQTASGSVIIVKPWIKWEYKTPESYSIITNSRRVWMITPEDNQVMTEPLEGFQLERIPILFLEDIQPLLENYTCDSDESLQGGGHRLILTRKLETLNVRQITLSIDSEGKPVEVAFIQADDSRNRFSLSNFIAAKDLTKKSIFVKIPPQYSIINFQGDPVTNETLDALRELE